MAQVKSNKTILIVLPRAWFSQQTINGLAKVLDLMGFVPLIIQHGNPEATVSVFALDNLPESDLEEVKRVVEESRCLN